MSSDETAAITLLTRACELDKGKRYTEAMLCYQEGLQLFLACLQKIQDKNKKLKFREKANEYLERCEQLDILIRKEKEAGNYHEQIRIAKDATGHSYETILGRFLDNSVRCVDVEDPYVRSHHQIVNFLRFAELLVKKCPNLSRLRLVTSPADRDGEREQQGDKLRELAASLIRHGVQLVLELSGTLHDREIRLDTGWIVKIGRGLDIYRAPEGKLVIGFYEMELRPCLETTVDIFYKKSKNL